eukprot:6379169-Amphidinium_carterae.1
MILTPKQDVSIIAYSRTTQGRGILDYSRNTTGILKEYKRTAKLHKGTLIVAIADAIVLKQTLPDCCHQLF